MTDLSTIINNANTEGIIVGVVIMLVVYSPQAIKYFANWICVMRGKPKAFPNGSEYLAAVREVTELIREVRAEIVANQKEIRNAQIDGENKREEARKEFSDADQHVKNVYGHLGEIKQSVAVLVDRQKREVDDNAQPKRPA